MSFWASLKNPFSNLQLFLSSMVLPPRPPKFLTFHGKSYDPSIEWIDEEGLLQDPLNHAPYPIHQRPQGEFIAFCFCWLICQFFFFFFGLGIWEIYDEHCHFVAICSVGILNVVCFGWKILCVGMLIWFFFLGIFELLSCLDLSSLDYVDDLWNFALYVALGIVGWILIFLIFNGYENYGNLMCRQG